MTDWDGLLLLAGVLYATVAVRNGYLGFEPVVVLFLGLLVVHSLETYTD